MSDSESGSRSRSSNGSTAQYEEGSNYTDVLTVQPLDSSPRIPSIPRKANTTFTIPVPPVERRWEYQVYRSEHEVQDVLEEYEELGELQYLVRRSNGQKSELLDLANGLIALDAFNSQHSDAQSATTSSSSSSEMVATRPARNTRAKAPGFTDFTNIDLSSEDELTLGKGPMRSTAKTHRPRSSRLNRKSFANRSDSSSSNQRPGRRQSSRSVAKRHYYNDAAGLDESEDDSESDDPSLGKRKRGNEIFHRTRLTLRGPSRRSDRSGRDLRSMHEIGEDDIPEIVTAQGAAKAIGAKETFPTVPSDNEFRLRHQTICDTCNMLGDDDQKGKLVFCQGCTMSYHQKCLGPRNSREHLATKVGEQNFVLQCRRCIGAARQKDICAPDQGMCSICRTPGEASTPFRDRKSTRQEQKDREDNGGEDPITQVPSTSIDNVNHVLFRCTACFRTFHFNHLPPLDDDVVAEDLDDEGLANKRFSEYCTYGNWACRQCNSPPTKVESLIAWRPINQEKYIPGTPTQSVNEDDKEYLVRWDKCSYSKSSWMPGPWIWGVTKHAMRSAFANRENGRNLPKFTFEDAVPEEWLRVDIVFDVRYTNLVKVQVEQVDLKRVKEVKQAYVKFKGLGYEDVVWDEPPDQQDTERWADFRSAYEEWVRGRYIHLPAITSLNNRLAKERTQNFEDKAMLKEQSKLLVGGQLMPYQLEGLNWLYYQWHRQQNAILADEMGLGKTIQVIGSLLALKEAHSCWPFLIVVPNSTCANWRREIKHWAPSLRVVTYFGSSEARSLSEKYELFLGKDKDLRCHIVVTSYDAAQDDGFRKVFRRVNWQALIVDEGQRLKNDKNILYSSLSALKAPFKVLLTGTPLQNNPRELFNLLQFLDTSIDAAELEKQYTELTKENVPRLHEMLRPFFLRRTKAQVLTFLPPMAQIIVPVTLTVLQKKLYKSILARNPDLLKAIFGGSKRALAKTERASLNNILMQLRKCLCHPFVYNRDIEERSSNVVISHRNLVEASSKLQLLEIMLPKLQERGHRVLIFSQFLDMLDMVEDFLDGLGLFYQRLDGTMGSLEKQKRIDEFNAPDSRLFAFLLSTRAGGVGINLATADTVIILDPDFNPHQDIQALSRAHRIGQKKKVLVFQLTTRSTAEEKIMQIGKKKMALDHALIEQMDADEDESLDVESILRHGTQALFQEEDANDIKYDPVSVDKLLDRSQIENTDIAKDQSAESQFSFARVWANDKGILEEGLDDENSDSASLPDTSMWDSILREREAEVAREAAERAETLGRGKRQRQNVDYAGHNEQTFVDTPRKSRVGEAEGSDTDFDAHLVESAEEDESSGGEGGEGQDVATELAEGQIRPSRSRIVDGVFRRAQVPQPQPQAHHSTSPSFPSNGVGFDGNSSQENQAIVNQCLACGTIHPRGSCPLKMSGVERCGLCGQAHFGFGKRKACAHLHDLDQCYLMLEALKQSEESRENKELVKKYLVGIIGNLRHEQKMAEERKREGLQQQGSWRPSLYTAQANGYPAPPPAQGEGRAYIPYPNPYLTNGSGRHNKENQPVD
ncbi:MAG: hypothetical protein L6R36_001264 [Xanthoria steineri]|nr:MAG: hypothetical protein L6R36_001264 [Xanthoria steineri]